MSERYEWGGGDMRVMPLVGSALRDTPLPAWQTQYEPPCIVLQSANKNDFLVLDSQTLAMGVVMVGGVGQGKTNVLRECMRQLLQQRTAQDTVLIFDAKGDFASAFYDRNDPAHVIVGSRAAYPTAVRWNIFGEVGEIASLGSEKTRMEEELHVRTIAKTLFEGREGTSQPFFALAAADLFARAMIHLIRQARQTGRRDVLCNRALRDWILSADAAAWKRMLTQDNPDFASSAQYFGGTKGDMGASVLATLNSMVNDLFLGDFGQGGAGDQFSMRDAVCSGGKVVFIEFDLSVGEVLCPVYRVLVDRAIKTRAGRGARSTGNLYISADEMKLLPRIDLADAVNLCRDLGNGRGVRVLAACQNVNQIIEQWGKEGAASLLGGFGTCIAFANPDGDTREYLCRRFGRIYQSILYEPVHDPVPVTREAFALEDSELLNFGRGETAVKIPFHPAFCFHFDRYS